MTYNVSPTTPTPEMTTVVICVAVPPPAAWPIVAGVVVPSPQSIVAECVSSVPTSVNVALIVIASFSAASPQQGEVLLGRASTGSTLVIVVVVVPVSVPVSSSVSVTSIV